MRIECLWLVSYECQPLSHWWVEIKIKTTVTVCHKINAQYGINFQDGVSRCQGYKLYKLIFLYPPGSSLTHEPSEIHDQDFKAIREL